MHELYIRPLMEDDAKTSYKWRNDPEIWKFTKHRPDIVVTEEIERKWIREILLRPKEKRFAICICGTDEYIGNVQLTEISSYDAELHIFIGEKKWWNSGVGTTATQKMVDFAFGELGLQCVYLFVSKDNIAAIKAYNKVGFYQLGQEDGLMRMAVYATDKKHKSVSIFMLAYNHEKFIKEALDGIIRQQRNFDIEIVVGEDKSTDYTRDILLSYANRYPHLFKLILYRTNVGAARNQLAVLSACKGTYIAMCEGDDYWIDPLKLQKQVDFLDANPAYVMSAHQVFERVGDKDFLSDLFVSKNAESFDILDLAKGNFIHTPSVVFRNRLFEKWPDWFLDSPVGDYVVYMLVARYGLVEWFPEPMAVYRKHQTSTWSSQPMVSSYNKFIKVLDLLLKESFPAEVREQLNIQKRRIVNRYLINVLESNDMQAFRSAMISFVSNDEVLTKEWLLDLYPDFISRLRNSKSYRAAKALADVRAKLFGKK